MQRGGESLTDRETKIVGVPALQLREIVFDTETTGLRPEDGDRVIEFGAVELIDRFPTGAYFHCWINPQGRPVHPDAVAVHGLHDQFLADKPCFAEIAPDLLGFLGDARLVAHNAEFDIAFLNAELGRIGLPAVTLDRVVDTLALARRKHPMGPNSLDALCARYNVDNSRRTRHGALLDAELLAEVYIEMTGGRQAAFILEQEILVETRISREVIAPRRVRPARVLAPRLSEADLTRHREFIARLPEPALWNLYQ